MTDIANRKQINQIAVSKGPAQVGFTPDGCPSLNCTVASWFASDTFAVLTAGMAFRARSIVPTQPPHDIPVTFRISVCMVMVSQW